VATTMATQRGAARNPRICRASVGVAGRRPPYINARGDDPRPAGRLDEEFDHEPVALALGDTLELRSLALANDRPHGLRPEEI